MSGLLLAFSIYRWLAEKKYCCLFESLLLLLILGLLCIDKSCLLLLTYLKIDWHHPAKKKKIQCMEIQRRCWIIVKHLKSFFFFSTEATCITEMSVMMACWKQSNFVDSLCSNEISAFYTCVEKARVRPPVCPAFEISQHMIKGCQGDIF